MGWLLVVLIVMFLSPWVGMWSLFRWLGRHESDIGELQRWVLSHHNLLPPHQFIPRRVTDTGDKWPHIETEAHKS